MLRAEIAALMTGEQFGVGHEPRHGTAFVRSWIEVLENDPKEIRAAAVAAQRISDWLMTRERERSLEADRPPHESPGGEVGKTREQGDPDHRPSWSECATMFRRSTTRRSNKWRGRRTHKPRRSVNNRGTVGRVGNPAGR